MDLTTIIGNCFNTEISTAIDILSPLSKQTRYLFFVVVFNIIITEKHKPHYIYCLQKIVLITAMLYHLPCILHLLPKHGAENHLNVLDEGIVPRVPLNNMMTDLIPPIKRLHGGVAGLIDAFGLDEFLEGDGDRTTGRTTGTGSCFITCEKSCFY